VLIRLRGLAIGVAVATLCAGLTGCGTSEEPIPGSEPAPAETARSSPGDFLAIYGKGPSKKKQAKAKQPERPRHEPQEPAEPVVRTQPYTDPLFGYHFASGQVQGYLSAVRNADNLHPGIYRSSDKALLDLAAQACNTKAHGGDGRDYITYYYGESLWTGNLVFSAAEAFHLCRR
jgi:hypothetical protein